MECCKVETDGCGIGVGNLNEDNEIINTEGCFTKLEDVIKSNQSRAIGVGTGVTFLLVIGIIIACCVGRNIGESM